MRIACPNNDVQACRERARNFGTVRSGLATDISKGLYTSTKRKRSRNLLSRKNTSFRQVRPYTQNLSNEFARTLVLMPLITTERPSSKTTPVTLPTLDW
jgi:hypothetical protein